MCEIIKFPTKEKIMSKAILINPFKQTLSEIELDLNRLPDIYAEIECDTFDCRAFGKGDVIVVDDNGLLKDTDEQAYFYFGVGEEVITLAGKALIVGGRSDGSWGSPAIDLRDIAELIAWIDNAEGAQFAKQFQPVVQS